MAESPGLASGFAEELFATKERKKRIENTLSSFQLRILPGLTTALLESAVAAPQASFGGKSPYADLAEVAAAYLYYLCRNHPFVDGNKRAALGACIVFLRLNGSFKDFMTQKDLKVMREDTR